MLKYTGGLCFNYSLKWDIIPSSTHTHSHTCTWICVKSYHSVVTPASFGVPCTTSRNSWTSTRQTPEARPSTHRSTGICLPAMIWPPKVPLVPWWSMAQSVVLFIPSLYQISILLFNSGLGGMSRGHFFLVVAGQTEHVNSRSIVKCLNH